MRLLKPLSILIILNSFFVSVTYVEADEIERKFQSDLRLLSNAYPDCEFFSSYDYDIGDWEIIVRADGRESVLYYAEGRFISTDQLDDLSHYRRMIYQYTREIMDPSELPPEFLGRIKSFSSPESRSSAPIASTAFFDAVYDTSSGDSAEKHLVYIDFLGYRIRPHEKIAGTLIRIEKRIRELAETEADVAEFVNQLGHASVYNRRTIRDTSGTSFHSMAIAIDLLPVNRSQKKIYWLWERNSGNSEWMLIPLRDRWMPPGIVVKIFESEGFIWGGNWPIWDNMHFEYRPELVLLSEE